MCVCVCERVCVECMVSVVHIHVLILFSHGLHSHFDTYVFTLDTLFVFTLEIV